MIARVLIGCILASLLLLASLLSLAHLAHDSIFEVMITSKGMIARVSFGYRVFEGGCVADGFLQRGKSDKLR